MEARSYSSLPFAQSLLFDADGEALHTPPATARPPVDDYDWVYDDPDLAPFLAGSRRRPETPLTAFA